MTRNYLDGTLVSFNYRKTSTDQPSFRTGYVNEKDTTDKVLNIQPADCFVTPYKSFKWSGITDLVTV